MKEWIVRITTHFSITEEFTMIANEILNFAAYNCITTIIKVLIIYSGNLKLILLLPSLFLMNETISPRSRKSWVFDTKLNDLQLLFSNCN